MRNFFILIFLLLFLPGLIVKAQPPAVAYQPFENGFMIWNEATGMINVYIGQGSGSIMNFPLWRYTSLSDNAFAPTPPPQRFKPTLGFGKVWSNFKAVRDELGWALEMERYYPMTISSPFIYSLPDGQAFQMTSLNQWTSIPTINSPIPTPAPVADLPISFRVEPNPMPFPDTAFTLYWDATQIEAASVEIEWHNPQGGTELRSGLPLTGNLPLQLADIFTESESAYFTLFALDSSGDRIPYGEGFMGTNAWLTIPVSTEMQIITFTGTSQGAQATLSWEVRSAHPVQVKILRYNIHGFPEETPELSVPLPLSGSITVDIPPEYKAAVTYVLEATDERGSSIRSEPVTVAAPTKP